MKNLDDPDSMAWQVPTLGVRITDRGLVRDPNPYENPDIPFSEITGSNTTAIYYNYYSIAFLVRYYLTILKLIYEISRFR